jgi:hypothetical protein
MVYDPVREQAIVFGGINDPNPFEPPQVFSDTWSLDLTVAPPIWTNRTPATSPPRRKGHVAVHDPTNDRIVIFGGVDPLSLVQRNDLWEWSLATNTWNPLAPTGGPPGPRESAMAVMDPIAGRLVMNGGNNWFNPNPGYGDTWYLQWTPSTDVPNGHRSGTGPLIDRAVFDRAARQLVIGFRLNGSVEARIEVLDLSGRRVGWSAVPPGVDVARSVRIAAEGFRSGMYFVQLSQGGLHANAKVVVMY